MVLSEKMKYCYACEEWYSPVYLGLSDGLEIYDNNCPSCDNNQPIDIEKFSGDYKDPMEILKDISRRNENGFSAKKTKLSDFDINKDVYNIEDFQYGEQTLPEIFNLFKDYNHGFVNKYVLPTRDPTKGLKPIELDITNLQQMAIEQCQAMFKENGFFFPYDLKNDLPAQFELIPQYNEDFSHQY